MLEIIAESWKTHVDRWSSKIFFEVWKPFVICRSLSIISPPFYSSKKMFTYHLIDSYQVWSVLRFFLLVTGFLWGQLLEFQFHLALGTSFQVEVQLCCSPTFLHNWLLTWLVFKFISKRWNLSNSRYVLNCKQENELQDTVRLILFYNTSWAIMTHTNIHVFMV